MLFMIVSSEEHAFNHCVSNNLSLVIKVEISESIRFVFSSKKHVIKWCAFSLGMGLRIHVFLLLSGYEVLLRSILCRMFSWIGEWSELRGRFVLVDDVN